MIFAIIDDDKAENLISENRKMYYFSQWKKRMGGNGFGWDGNVNCFKQRKDFTQSYFHWEITSGFLCLK